MASRITLAIGEWYHCYNRGVDRRIIFEKPRDYERFMLLLYLCNGTKETHISDFKTWSLYSFLADDKINRGEKLVEVGAYALMPNHFHFVLKEILPGGIVSFMRKVCTGYSMYFNTSRHRTGVLFSGRFKSKHVHDDRYLKQVVPYVLLNPAELFDPKWKKGEAFGLQIHTQLLEYPYSSMPDFTGTQRPESVIVGDSLPTTCYDQVPTLAEMIENAQAYYREHPSST